jgi:hypothetical protein
LPIETDAPLAVEIRPYTQGNRYLVFLMNYITSQLRIWPNLGGPAAEDSIPVRDISIHLRTARPVSRVYLASNKTVALPFENKGGVVSVRIPALDVFDIVVME